MQIERIYYPVETLGYGKRIGIWMIGCPHACLKCCNPELWDNNPTKEVPLQTVYKMIQSIHAEIDGVTISGGEPFQQLDELSQLVSYIASEITDDILIYTGYTLNELKKWNDSNVDNILNSIACLIDGRYIDTLNDNKPLRGSSNQTIHLFKEKYRSRYEELLHGQRKVQLVSANEQILAFGIPIKDTKDVLHEKLPQFGVTIEKD